MRRITEISTLPYIAVRVMKIANDPDSGVHEIKDVVEADPALSARILRCVNSSAYAMQTKITNLQQAIAYLGVKQICNLVMTASVSSVFQKDVSIGRYNRKQLWRHLVAVGVCARMIARRMRLRHFEDVFLAGLLHDLGIILEDQHVHGSFVEVIRSVGAGKTLVETERRNWVSITRCSESRWPSGGSCRTVWPTRCAIITTPRPARGSTGTPSSASRWRITCARRRGTLRSDCSL